MGEIYYNQGRVPFELYAPEAEKVAFSLLPVKDCYNLEEIYERKRLDTDRPVSSAHIASLFGDFGGCPVLPLHEGGAQERRARYCTGKYGVKKDHSCPLLGKLSGAEQKLRHRPGGYDGQP